MAYNKGKTNSCELCLVPERTMDDCYNQTIERLTNRGKIKEISARMLTFTTNHERVLYTHSLLKELAFIPVLRTNPKSDKVATYYRNQGNKFYLEHKMYEAIQAFNLGLLYSIDDSDNLIYCVSNRSAVLYSMERYEECLNDIKFVFSMQFPENLRDKLIRRKQLCLAKIKETEANDRDPNDKIIEELLKLKSTKDEKYLCASSKLKVVFTKEMGRHVIAKEDIQVGEVLVQEDPYITVLEKSQTLFCCAFCLSRTMNLYPCLYCTYTLYCSVTCRETAYEQYHSVECGLLPSLMAMEFTKMERLPVRALLRSRSDQKNWNDTFRTAEKAESRTNTDLWGCVKEGDKWVYDSKYYTSIHTLISNIEKRSVSDIFRKSLTAAVLTHFFSVSRFLRANDYDTAERIKRYVTSVLMHHVMTGPTNMHTISTNIENSDGNFVDEYIIASGAYAFLSLLNHSCSPNVVRYSKQGSTRMSLIAIRPIKKGMQIFDNYGFHYAVQDRKTRHANLSFQYKFTCTCEACINDWPLYENLKEAASLPAGILKKKNECLTSEIIHKLMKGDKDTAVKCYKPLCELIEVLDAFAPCKELGECQEALKQCLVIFEGVVPFGYTKTIPWRVFPHCAVKDGPHEINYLSGPTI